MSTRTEPQQTVLFLLSCIRHSNDGKVDFEAVAKELNIVTKAAAAKRYERLIKSSKDSASAKQTNTASGAAAAYDGDEKPAKPTTTKRKALALSAPKASPLKKVKAAPGGRKAKAKTKVEEKEDAEEEIKAESESSLSDAPEDLDELVKEEEA